MNKILILDDELTILDNLKFILELENYNVRTAQNGQVGLVLFQLENDFDCIICDMKMPDMTGIEFTKAIKEINPNIGVIILTGHGDMENAIAAMKAGAYDYLSKPVNTDKLIFSIENSIKKLHLIEENRKLNQELIRKNLYFQHIYDSAQQILYHMTPRSCPLFDKVHTYVVYKSCDVVGGDMFDIFKVGDKIMFYIFDVCGHGILSAVMTMMLRSYFQNLKLTYEYTGSIPDMKKYLMTINREMINNTSSNLYVTLFAGILDMNTHELNYISAGHVDQYLQTRQGMTPLTSTGTVIGLLDEATYDSESVKMLPGDRLFLFTDGILEVWKEEILSTAERLQGICFSNANNPLSQAVQSIYDGILNLHADANPDDDITILGIEMKP